MALRAMAFTWPVLELLLRAAGASGLGPLLSSRLAGDQAAVAVGFPLLATAAAVIGLRVGITTARRNVHLGSRHLLLGAALGVLTLALAGLASLADRALFPTKATTWR